MLLEIRPDVLLLVSYIKGKYGSWLDNWLEKAPKYGLQCYCGLCVCTVQYVCLCVSACLCVHVYCICVEGFSVIEVGEVTVTCEGGLDPGLAIMWVSIFTDG